MSKWLIMYFALACSGFAISQEQPAVRQPPPAGETDECAMGGYRLNMKLEKADLKKLRKEKPAGYEKEGAKFYRTDEANKASKAAQYVAVKDGTVLEIVRAYDPELLDNVINALKTKYGEPTKTTPPVTDTSFMGTIGKITTHSDATFRDQRCGLELSLVYTVRESHLGSIVSTDRWLTLVVKASENRNDADLLK